MQLFQLYSSAIIQEPYLGDVKVRREGEHFTVLWSGLLVSLLVSLCPWAVTFASISQSPYPP